MTQRSNSVVLISRPVTTLAFGAVTGVSFLTGVHQLFNGSGVSGSLFGAGAVAWAYLTRNRLDAHVVIDQRVITTHGHLTASTPRSEVTHISVSRASRVSYDVSVATSKGAVHRLASHVSKRRANELNRALRNEFKATRN